MYDNEFFRRLGGTAAETGQADGPAGAPPAGALYLYVTSAVVINVAAAFRPGADGIIVVQAGPMIKTGTMKFEADVEWDDGGTRRTGWIHSWSAEGMDPMPVFLPDFATGQYYQGCATTLPYTPGQPPSGLDQPVGFWRRAIG